MKVLGESMTFVLLALAVLSGAVLCSCTPNLISKGRSLSEPRLKYFGVLGLAIAADSLLQIAGTFEAATFAGPLLRLQGVTNQLVLATIILFGRDYTLRRIDWLDRAALLSVAALSVYSLASPVGLQYSTASILEGPILPRSEHPLFYGTTGGTYLVACAIAALQYVRQLIAALLFFRQGNKWAATLWAVGMVLVTFGVTYNAYVDVLASGGERLGAFAFPVMVLAIGTRRAFERAKEQQVRLTEQRTLSKSEAKLRELFEKSADAIFIHDAKTDAIIDVNCTTTDVYGYSVEECRSLAIAELSAKGFENSQERALRSFRDNPTQNEAVFLWQAKRKDHSEFFAEASLKRVSIASKPCVVVTVRDVSERVASAMALKREENFVSTLLDSLPGAFYLCNGDLRLLRWNRNLERRLGYEAARLTNMSMVDWFPEGPSRDATIDALRTWLEQGQGSLTQEVRVKKTDGTLVPYLTTSARLDTHEGAMLMGVGIDISDLVEAQVALRESEERHRLLFDSSGDAILLLLHGRIVDCNAQALSLFGGVEHSSLVGQQFLSLSPELQRDGTESARAIMAFAEAAELGAPQRFEWQHQRVDGSPFLSEVSFNLLELRGQRHIQVIVRDITEKRRLEERLLQAQRLEAIGHLAGGVAHDFNNLLTPILGNIEMVLADTDDSLVREALEEAHEAADRAKRLSRQLLTFGRRAVLEVSSIDLCQLVRGMERLLRGLLREDIELRLHLEAEGIVVRADPSHLEQVVMNLVVNARDAMPNGGLVSVSVGRRDIESELCSAARDCTPGEYAVLSVADTGSGMSDEVKKRLFEPFFTTKGAGKGTGLGLSTVFGIVEQHRGTLSVYSEVGQGSTLNVFLPLEGGAQTSESKRAPDSSAFGGCETILVVEDDETVRGFVCRTLTRHGYTTHVACSSEEALNLFESLPHAPNLVLTDVVLPGMNGPAMFQQMQSSGKALRVLYMSGYSGDTISHQGVYDANSLLLQKPFSARDLLAKVRSVLNA